MGEERVLQQIKKLKQQELKLTEYGKYKIVGSVHRLAIKKSDCLVSCKDCGLTFVIDAKTPLNEALPSHVWGEGEGIVRHRTYEDELAEQADRELCPECGCYPCEHTHGL